MNRFRGLQEDGTTIKKLSREDDQLLALNYENLCDLDYLSRVLTEDSLVSAGVSLDGVKQARVGGSSGQQSSYGGRTGGTSGTEDGSREGGQPSITQGWDLTPDLPEDLILFGDLPALGKLS